MPYLPVDLDGKRKAHGIERALGLPRHAVAGGLNDLWEVVWRDKSPVVDDLTLDEAFGPDPRIRPALVARGFLEPTEGGHRVKGAAKWLFGLEGKSRGGRAAKGNLIPGPKPKGSAEDSATPEPIPSASAEAKPEPPLRQGFGSFTQHPAPSTQIKEEELRADPVSAMSAVHVPSVVAGAEPDRRAQSSPMRNVVLVPEKPTKPEESWMGGDFWAWAQVVRMKQGHLAEEEQRIETLDRWWSNCLMTPGVTVHALRLGFVHGFGREKFWEGKGFPFAAFMKGWRKYVRTEVLDAAG